MWDEYLEDQSNQTWNKCRNFHQSLVDGVGWRREEWSTSNTDWWPQGRCLIEMEAQVSRNPPPPPPFLPHFPQIGVQPGSGDNQVLLVGCGASSDGAMVGRRAEGDLPQRTFATLFYSRMIERKIHRIFTENFPIMTNFSCRSSSCCFCLFATHLLASGHGIQLTGEPPWRPQRPGPYLSTDWWERDSWLCRKLPQSNWPRWTTRMLISRLFLRKNIRPIGSEYFWTTHRAVFSQIFKRYFPTLVQLCRRTQMKIEVQIS